MLKTDGDLQKGELGCLLPDLDHPYPVWTPYNATEAAAALQRFLEDESVQRASERYHTLRGAETSGNDQVE
jgi:hypothetical protein